MNTDRLGAVFSFDRRIKLAKVWFGLGCVLILLIIYFSLTPHAYIPDRDHADKLFHTAGYLILTLWWMQLYSNPIMRLLLVIAFSLLGVGIEIIQSFHPLRYFDVYDMMANCFGITFGWSFGFTWMGSILYKVESFFLRRESAD